MRNFRFAVASSSSKPNGAINTGYCRVKLGSALKCTHSRSGVSFSAARFLVRSGSLTEQRPRKPIPALRQLC